METRLFGSGQRFVGTQYKLSDYTLPIANGKNVISRFVQICIKKKRENAKKREGKEQSSDRAKETRYFPVVVNIVVVPREECTTAEEWTFSFVRGRKRAICRARRSSEEKPHLLRIAVSCKVRVTRFATRASGDPARSDIRSLSLRIILRGAYYAMKKAASVIRLSKDLF